MRHTLDFLKQLAHGLAIQFGSSCEIAIHDLKTKDLEKSIVYIENGHVSNRPEMVLQELFLRRFSRIRQRFMISFPILLKQKMDES